MPISEAHDARPGASILINETRHEASPLLPAHPTGKRIPARRCHPHRHGTVAQSMTRIEQGTIHVAGIIDAAEAETLVDCGIAYLGFPLLLGYHREDLSVAEAAAIVAELHGRATFFLITYSNSASSIIDLCEELGVDLVQLHGEPSLAELKRLRESAEHLRVIKSLIVREDNLDALVDQVNRFCPFVDAFLTDSFDPATGASGATGKTHDWAVSREIVRLAPKPVILAGGLDVDNVQEAIDIVRPAGVDVHTGIEGPDGRKQPDITKQFVARARAGFSRIT